MINILYFYLSVPYGVIFLLPLINCCMKLNSYISKGKTSFFFSCSFGSFF
uniref:Uncharacterized protein n=1 Tax=Arundo donax TaxID=35708 RepID=A0A0A9SDX1_ARUDO